LHFAIINKKLITKNWQMSAYLSDISPNASERRDMIA